MPETKTERLRRERQAGLDYLWPYYKRLKQIIESLSEPKADPKNPTYRGRRGLAHQKLLQELPFLIERTAGDAKAEFALAGIMNTLGHLLPLDKEWQTVHVKNFPLKVEQQIILEENAKLEDEGFKKHGRSKEMLRRNPSLQKMLSDVKDPEKYITRTIREKYKK